MKAKSSIIKIEKYGIMSPEDYHYLNQSGCMRIPHINDAEEFDRVKVKSKRN